MPAAHHRPTPARRLAALAFGLGGATALAHTAAAQSDGLGGLADTIGLELGVAADADAIDADDAYVELLVTDATMLSTVDDLAIGVVQPEPGVYDFSRADAIVDLAEANGLRVRGHGLVGPDGLPPWLTGGTWTAESLAAVLREHVTTVIERYADRNPGVVTQWDVAAEAFLPDGSRRPTIWQQVIGDGYLEIAFDAARSADPDATLFYSDFFDDLSIVDDAVENGVPLTPGATAERSTCDAVPKCVGVRSAVAGLLEAGAPVDGVGFQAHLYSPDPYDFAVFTDWVEPLGLQWAITEFDVPVPVTEVTNPDVLSFQAEAYRAALTACLDDPVCDTFVMWGITDRISPVPAETDGVFGGALPRDANGDPKPAHDAVAAVLTDRAAATPTTEPASSASAPDTSTPPVSGPADGAETAGDSDDDDGATAVVVVAGIAVAAIALLAGVALRRRTGRRSATTVDGDEPDR